MILLIYLKLVYDPHCQDTLRLQEFAARGYSQQTDVGMLSFSKGDLEIHLGNNRDKPF